MNTIVNLDLDFFVTPTYLGHYYSQKEYQSYTDYQAKSKLWLQPEEFIEKVKLKKIKGCSVAEDKQPILYWRSIINEVDTILHFDAHPDIYLYKDIGDEYYNSLELTLFHNYDYMFIPFREEWIKHFYWIVPDYFDDELMNKHFKNTKFNIKNGIISNKIGPTRVQIRLIKWSEFDPTLFNYKYLSITLNNNMCRYSTDLINKLNNYIR